MKEFLDAVLPTEGLYGVGVLKDRQFTNSFGSTTQWAVDKIVRADAAGVDAYFALATFIKSGSRTQDNVLYVKSFWLDIDTQESKPNEKYATRKEAVKAVSLFCAELGLPLPIFVSSGYGVHSYWPLTENIDGLRWKDTAILLKQACKVWGLAADPSRTADQASVLRPVDTNNYKYGAAKKVKGGAVVPPITYDMFTDAVTRYLTRTGAMPAVTRRVEDSINSDLMMTARTFEASSGHKIAEHCAVMGLMRDTCGNIDQPTWFRGLGVLKDTVEGEALCHEWSKGHPQYSASETDKKIVQVEGYGPSSCERFGEGHPELCKACPSKGKIKSPIQLGTAMGGPNYTSFVAPGTTTAMIFPDGFGWGPLDPTLANSRDVLWADKKVPAENPDGSPGWTTVRVEISDSKFHPVGRVQTTEKTHHMLFNSFVDDVVVGEFLIDNSIAIDNKEMQKELARREIVIESSAEHQLKEYLKGWIKHLKGNSAIIPAAKQFGWAEDGMVVGGTYLTPKGDHKAVVTHVAQKYAASMVPKGDLPTWVDMIDRLYNFPGLEGHQFCILASFASPLFKLLKLGGGMMTYSHSVKGAHGKSTAQEAALGVWADPSSELMLSNKMFTDLALYEHFGTMGNLPGIIDEMTSCTPEFVGEFVYCISNGRGRKRLTSEANMRFPLNWSTIGIGSGNRLLSEKMAAASADSTAQLMRLWEYTLPDDLKFNVDTNEANRLTMLMKEQYGHAGLAYARYLVDNKDAVSARVVQMREELGLKMQFTPRERFWSALHACVFTALEITKKMGLLAFDEAALEAWVALELAKSRGQVVQSVSNPLECFSRMLSDLFKGILVTDGEGNLQVTPSQSAYVVRHPQGPIIGRHMLPQPNSTERLYLSASAARQWCQTTGTSWVLIQTELMNAGIFVKGSGGGVEHRVSLGKGVREYSGMSGQANCISVDMSRLRNSGVNIPLAQTVTVVPSTPQIIDKNHLFGVGSP